MSEPTTKASKRLLRWLGKVDDEKPGPAVREALAVIEAEAARDALTAVAGRIEALPVLTIAVDRQMLPGVPPKGVFQMPPATITVTNAPHDGPGLIDRFLVLAALSAEDGTEWLWSDVDIGGNDGTTDIRRGGRLGGR